MSKLSIVLFSLLLVACGNGNDQNASTYAYTQNGYVPGGMCPPQVAMDWNNFVAAPCNQSQGFGGMCARGIEAFIQRDNAFLQGVGCQLVTAQARWCPNDWRQRNTFQVNLPILQATLTQVGGPGSFPVNGGGFPR